MKIIFYVFISLVLISCTPKLKENRIGSAFFKTNEGCSKGPFNIRTFTMGSTWGEYLKLIVYTKRDIKFNVTVQVKGNKPVTTSWGQSGSENSCRLKSENSETMDSTNENISESSGKIVLLNPPEKRSSAHLIKIDSSDKLHPFLTRYNKTKRTYVPINTYKTYNIKILDHKIEDIDTKPLKTGTPVKITIWTQDMSDYKDMVVYI
jgi:hypothetical protein